MTTPRRDHMLDNAVLDAELPLRPAWPAALADKAAAIYAVGPQRIVAQPTWEQGCTQGWEATDDRHFPINHEVVGTRSVHVLFRRRDRTANLSGSLP